MEDLPGPMMVDDLTAFITARLDVDERAACDAVRKRYPRWRVWLRKLRHG